MWQESPQSSARSSKAWGVAVGEQKKTAVASEIKVCLIVFCRACEVLGRKPPKKTLSQGSPETARAAVREETPGTMERGRFS